MARRSRARVHALRRAWRAHSTNASRRRRASRRRHRCETPLAPSSDASRRAPGTAPRCVRGWACSCSAAASATCSAPSSAVATTPLEHAAASNAAVASSARSAWGAERATARTASCSCAASPSTAVVLGLGTPAKPGDASSWPISASSCTAHASAGEMGSLAALEWPPPPAPGGASIAGAAANGRAARSLGGQSRAPSEKSTALQLAPAGALQGARGFSASGRGRGAQQSATSGGATCRSGDDLRGRAHHRRCTSPTCKRGPASADDDMTWRIDLPALLRAVSAPQRPSGAAAVRARRRHGAEQSAASHEQ